MTNAHLREVHAIVRAFYAIIISTTGETVPHRLHICRDCRSGPVGITVIGDNTSKMLELIVLEFNRTFQPVLAVKIHHDTALVKALMTLGKIGLHDETEILFTRLHLEYRCIVITEMIIRSLPEISMRCGGDGQCIAFHRKRRRLPGPLKVRKIHFTSGGKSRSDAIRRICFSRVRSIVSA